MRMLQAKHFLALCTVKMYMIIGVCAAWAVVVAQGKAGHTISAYYFMYYAGLFKVL
jgi:hypothetical protein